MRTLKEADYEEIASRVVRKIVESVRSGELGLVAGKEATCQDQEKQNQELAQSPTMTKPEINGALSRAREMGQKHAFDLLQDQRLRSGSDPVTQPSKMRVTRSNKLLKPTGKTKREEA
jgi:hypothetical protein